ncbi:hypothetical protein FGB62_235g017 [Gracilaria domingensis]|nr:hypothetical protein FGB62_235g017 [Gracilaria domingensis]
MAKKKKSKADKRSSHQQFSKHSATTDPQTAQRDTSPPPKRAKVKEEPEVIDVDRLSHPTPDELSNEKQSQPSQNHSRQQIKQKPDEVTPAAKPSKKRPRSPQDVSSSDESVEPTPKARRISAPDAKDASAEAERNPGEKTMVCETVVEQKDVTHVIVTTKEQYPTAVRCPCQKECGKFVRVGPYAKTTEQVKEDDREESSWFQNVEQGQ